jgi:hypothetical protein
MSAPSLIATPGGQVLSPAWLHAKLASIFGADLIGLWIGEDLVVDISNNVTSWPGRVGPTLASNLNKFTPTAVNGRKGFFTAVNNNKSLTGTIAAARSFLSVHAPRAGIATTSTVITNPSDPFTTVSPFTDWFTGSGWSHYLNGAATDVLPSVGPALVVAESDKASNVNTALEVGGSAASGVCWMLPIMLIAAIAVIPTAPKRSGYLNPLREYYRLP